MISTNRCRLNCRDSVAMISLRQANAVKEDGAGPALALAAAVLGPGQPEVVAKDAEQAALAIGLDGPLGAVDEQFLDGWHGTHPRDGTAGERPPGRRLVAEASLGGASWESHEEACPNRRCSFRNLAAVRWRWR